MSILTTAAVMSSLAYALFLLLIPRFILVMLVLPTVQSTLYSVCICISRLAIDRNAPESDHLLGSLAGSNWMF